MAASLRLPRSVSRDEKKAIVDAIITELGLQKAANTQIGEVQASSSDLRQTSPNALFRCHIGLEYALSSRRRCLHTWRERRREKACCFWAGAPW